GAGRLLRVPFALETLFSKAAAGLKNMCANLDHGTEPKSTVVAMRYSQKSTPAPAPPRGCTNAQTRPSVTLARSDRMKRSARTTRNGEWPSAATSTRMKNQNQYPPASTIRPPSHQSCGRIAGAGVAGVG